MKSYGAIVKWSLVLGLSLWLLHWSFAAMTYPSDVTFWGGLTSIPVILFTAYKTLRGRRTAK